MTTILIKPVTVYRIETTEGKPLGIFTLAESWEGMQKFVSEDGSEHVIIDSYDDRDPLSKLFNDPAEPRKKEVVKITPSLFAKMKSKDDR